MTTQQRLKAGYILFWIVLLMLLIVILAASLTFVYVVSITTKYPGLISLTAFMISIGVCIAFTNKVFNKIESIW